jgi:N-acetylglucosamine malate deacetylase 2
MTTARGEDVLDRLCADDARPAPTVVLVVAHPDDETFGAGSRLPRLRDGRVVLVTDGAPRDMRDAEANGLSTREDYARARRDELLAALALADLGPERLTELGRVDQEASLDLAGLARDLEAILRESRPEAVLTHAYEGGHPDHDAAAFAVHAACRLLEARGLTPPVIVEMACYQGAGGRTAIHEFVPAPGREPTTLELSDEQRAFKRRLYECHRTQWRVLGSFPVAVERFRLAPAYDFTAPPHAGRLNYERFEWGMTGDRWRDLAAAALAELGNGGAG